jgi:hypothetical protein
MANEFNPIQAGTMSPEDYAQQQALNRQQQMATLLMQQGQQQPQGQMVSGRYVPTSFFQNLQPVVNMLTGAYLAKSGDTEAAKLAQKIRDAKSVKEQAITNLITGTPEVKTELAGPYAGNVPMPVATKEATKPDLAAALREISTNNPYGAGAEYKAAIVGNMIPKTPDSVAKYKFAQTPEGGNYKGSLADFENQMNDYQKADLALKRQAQALQQGGANLTEFQGKATNFGVQMAGSIGEMAAVEKSGFNPASSKNQALLSVSGTTLGNYLVPPEVQRYKQGMDNFTESYIRFKSGANVPMHEIEKDLKNMMPQPGDLQDKLEQKQRARERALQGMAISAGPGAKFIAETYKIEAPGMKNEKPAAPTPNATPATPSLWGKATVVGG